MVCALRTYNNTATSTHEWHIQSYWRYFKSLSKTIFFVCEFLHAKVEDWNLIFYRLETTDEITPIFNLLIYTIGILTLHLNWNQQVFFGFSFISSFFVFSNINIDFSLSVLIYHVKQNVCVFLSFFFSSCFVYII